jgi:hypothetical protein
LFYSESILSYEIIHKRGRDKGRIKSIFKLCDFKFSVAGFEQAKKDTVRLVWNQTGIYQGVDKYFILPIEGYDDKDEVCFAQSIGGMYNAFERGLQARRQTTSIHNHSGCFPDSDCRFPRRLQVISLANMALSSSPQESVFLS